MKNKQPMAEAISSQNQMAELLLHLKQCSSLPPPTTTAGKEQHQETPSTHLPWSGGVSPSTNDRYDEPNHPSEGDRPVKVVGSTTSINNISTRKRKLDELNDADKDEEIRQLKEEVQKLKKTAKYYESTTSKVKHQKEVSVLKTRLQDVEAQLAYKDRLIIEGVTELDLLEGLMAAERDRHSAKEQFLVEERRAVEDLLVVERDRHSAKEQLWVEARHSVEELLAAERDRRTTKEQLWVEERRSVNALLVVERDRHSAKEKLLVEDRRLVEELLAAERDRHSAKEQLLVEERRATEDSLVAKEKMWVKERQALNDSICSLQSRVEELLVHNRRLEGDRKWLISEGFSHAIDKVHHSDGFWQPNKDSISFALFLGFQYGLKYGYSQSAKGCPIEKLDYYRPGLKGKMHLAFNWLENCRFPYVEKLSSMVDQPLDVIRSLEPENSGARKIKNIHDVINNVDEFLKRESGH